MMFRHLCALGVGALLLSSASAFAVNCPAASYTLNSQEEVDSFPQTCDTVTADLRIRNNAGTNITNLDALANLVAVGDDLYLDRNAALSDISGLSGITTVGGFLRVRDNDALTSLNGLHNIQSIGEYLRIDGNLQLATLDGLAGLTSIGGYLRLDNNAALASISGLAGLTGINGNLIIRNNDSLANLAGLQNLASVSRNVQLRDNNVLSDTSALSSLASIGGYLWLINNDQQVTLAGFGALASVGTNVFVSGNAALQDLNGLAGLASVSGFLRLDNNPALVDLSGLSGIGAVGNYLRIRNNDALADLDALANVVSVTNNVIIDRNNNLAQCRGLIPLLDSIDDAAPGPGPNPNPPGAGQEVAPDVGGFAILGTNGTGCNSIAEVTGAALAPAFAQVIAPGVISVSGTVTTARATFSIDNSASPARATELAFSNTLPAGLVLATPANASTDCTAGNLVAADGGNQLDFSAGIVDGAASCVVEVDLAGTTEGDFLNVTGDLTFTLGNAGTASASLAVDDTPPVIAIQGDNPLALVTGDSFVDPGATATDNRDGPVPVTSTDNVNTGMPGSYTVDYEAMDAAGNLGTAQRVVNVTAAPVRSFTGTLPSGATGTLSFTTADAGCTFAGDPQFIDGSGISPAPPEGLLLLDGLVSFAIEGCAVGASVTLAMDYGAAIPAGQQYWKVASPWRSLPATVSGTTITFTLVDGGPDDDDGIADGRIVDPSGAASLIPAAPRPVPTGGGWVFLSMVTGLVLAARRRLRGD